MSLAHCAMDWSVICDCDIFWSPGYINLEFILKLKIKCNDWLLADTDTCPQAANHFALF